MHVSEVTASVLNGGFFKFAMAKVTVVDERGNAIPRATVTGSFSGDVSGSFSATTDDEGLALVIHPNSAMSGPSYTFCVSDLTHDYFNTYDSGANDVTCASR